MWVFGCFFKHWVGSLRELRELWKLWKLWNLWIFTIFCDSAESGKISVNYWEILVESGDCRLEILKILIIWRFKDVKIYFIYVGGVKFASNLPSFQSNFQCFHFPWNFDFPYKIELEIGEHNFSNFLVKSVNLRLLLMKNIF